MSIWETAPNHELVELLSSKVVGQSQVFEHIVPYLEMHRASLTPEGRPIGIFLLLGPTGTGKTHTVEALAEVLHGSHKTYLRIDCGEYQLDHEVARLVGAPPGYLGHRETRPVLSAEALRNVTSASCPISLVLFDEIEKAAPSLVRLLLGVLDKARLQMGDNSSVNFESAIVFLTSNLGAREMMREINPSFGFDSVKNLTPLKDVAPKLEAIALSAVRKRFPPEFVNRIDSVLTYQPLSDETVSQILDLQIDELRRHVKSKLGAKGFQIEVSAEAKKFLMEKGSSVEYGARELKRAVYRYLTQPLATVVAQNKVEPGGRIVADLDTSGEKLRLRPVAASRSRSPKAAPPAVLIVDDNHDLLRFLARLIQETGYQIVTAETAADARRLAAERDFDVAMLDYMLPDADENGLTLGIALKERRPNLHVMLVTGALLQPDEMELCEKNGFPLVRKPFLVNEILEPLQRRLKRRSASSS